MGVRGRDEIIERALTWSGKSYALATNNCQSFVEDIILFAFGLNTDEPEALKRSLNTYTNRAKINPERTPTPRKKSKWRQDGMKGGAGVYHTCLQGCIALVCRDPPCNTQCLKNL